jgi:mutual gliding-motility protein MglA
MVLFNYSTRELTAKIVYYGPGLCGKTTNLQFIHENLPGEVKGKMLSLATKTDRTLFFDFLPIDLGEIRGMKTRVQLYTVPGQVFYNETRKLVLKGADGIVFVADSQETMLGANIESFKNLEENLKAHGMKLAEMPHVIQFNKRDLPKLAAIEDLNAAVNKYNGPFYESVATTGIGVQDTLKAIVKLVLLHLTKKYDPKSMPAADRTIPISSPVAKAATAAAPAPATKAATKAAKPAPAPAPAPAVAKAEPAAPRRSKSSPPPPSPAPPPPAPVPVAAEPLPTFNEDEIDGLVGDVAEMEAPIAPAPPARSPVPVPVAAAPVSTDEDGAIWLGAPEGDEGGGGFPPGESTYGANVSLQDLLSAETDPGPAPRTNEPEPSAWSPTARFGSEFEVDRGFDPEWSSAGSDEAPPPAPPAREAKRGRSARAPEPIDPEPPPPPTAADPEPEPAPPSLAAAAEEEEVVLTEVASDSDLFADPSLEIARLGGGEQREILVPVQVGEGAAARRFKLSIRLRLDPVD